MPFYAIISDVHANLEALNAVLKEIEKERIDEILFLGDSVGYGPNPNECIESLRDSTEVILAGNHDWAAIGMTDITYFNPYARAAIEWTEDVLSDENKTFLRELPVAKKLRHGSILLVHSTPKEPEQWHYLSSMWDAYINFHFFTEKICFIGHSHVPAIIEAPPEGELRLYPSHVEIKDGHRYIINVGSVGQPRDGNPDAAYVLFNEDSIEIRRVSYDIVLTQKKMRKAGLPSYLIDRLVVGR
jgi:predicted phosphodiesterase